MDQEGLDAGDERHRVAIISSFSLFHVPNLRYIPS